MQKFRTVVFALVLALIAAACGAADGDVAALPPDDSSTPPVVSSGDPVPTDDTVSADTEQADEGAPPDETDDVVERPEPNPDRELAPDFSLGLSDGSTFVLSQEVRPVFMVFWAEW